MAKKRVAVALAVNGAVAVGFLWLTQWALAQQLEETFLVLAAGHGLVSVCVNAALAAARR